MKADQLEIQNVINSIFDKCQACIRKSGQHFETELNIVNSYFENSL